MAPAGRLGGQRRRRRCCSSLVGAMVGQTQLTQAGPAVAGQTAAIVGAMNAVLAVPVARLVAWAAGASAGTPPGRQDRADRAVLSR